MRCRYLCLFMTLGSVAARADFKRDSYRDIRMLGRGNAGIADVTGGISAFYNPAGLADSNRISFVPLDIALGVNKHVGTSWEHISTLTSDTNTIGQKFSPFLGKPMALQGTTFPNVSVPGFMIGYYNYADVNLEYRDPVYPKLDLQARNDWGLVFGGGWNVTPNIQLGASLRYMKRKSLSEVLDMASVFNLSVSYLKEIMENGEAWGLNVGARAHKQIGTTSWVAGGIAVEDLNGTKFRNADRGPLPDRQAQKFNVGVGYGTAIPYGDFRILFDMKELGDPTLSMTKKVYTGVEVALPLVTLRSGLFQGYWTAGVTTSIIPIFDLDIMTYGEELNSAAGLRESRYWMIGLRTGLDLNKSKKKKQRYSLDHL